MKLPEIGKKPGPAVRTERWYDRRAKTWVVQKKDSEGNQIGDSAFSGTRAGAIAIEDEWRREIVAEYAKPGVERID